MRDRTLPFVFGLTFSLALTVWVAPSFSRPPDEFKLTQRQQAELFLIQKKFHEAIRLYTDIVEKEDGGSQDYRALIKAYEGAGRLTDAETYIKNRMVSHPESSPILYAYGYCLYLLGRDSESGEYLGKALKADPANALALNNLGALLARQKAFAEAVEYIKKAISTSPEELIFFQNLKSVYTDMGAPERFVDEYRESLRESATSLKTTGYGKTIAVELRQKGFKLYSEQKITDAIEMFSKLLVVYREIKHTPGIVATLFSLGLLHEEIGDSKLAEQYYLELLEINPNHIQAREKMRENR